MLWIKLIKKNYKYIGGMPKCEEREIRYQNAYSVKDEGNIVEIHYFNQDGNVYDYHQKKDIVKMIVEEKGIKENGTSF